MPMRYIISPAIATLAFALPALAEVPKVVTDIHPVHALVAQVMGDLGTPDLLLERGASEHDFQLRPSQAASLADADLVVWIGPELTPWLNRALDGIGENGAELREKRRFLRLQVDGRGGRRHVKAKEGGDGRTSCAPARQRRVKRARVAVVVGVVQRRHF